MNEHIDINEIEKMKAMWRELNNRVTSLEENNKRLAKEITTNKIKTAREKLMVKYRIFIILACVMIIYIGLMVAYMPNTVEKYRVPVFIYCCVFFLFEALVDTYLLSKVKKIDVYNSTIMEIARQSIRNWKIHKIAVFIGFPMAVGAIILLALLMNADSFALSGLCVGALIGFALGIRQLYRFMQYYRQMQ